MIKKSEIKNLLFDLEYECENYRYQIISYMTDYPDYHKDLDSHEMFYRGFDHALSVILSKLELTDEYIKFSSELDKKNGIINLENLPKLDNPFDVPEKLQ